MEAPSPQAPEVRIKTVCPQRFVAVRTRTTPQEFGQTLASLLQRVWEHLGRQPSVTVGPAIARYHAFDDREIDAEAGFPVLEPVPGDGAIRTSELPGGLAATLLVRGSYRRLPEAYAQLEEWIRRSSYIPDGAPWDIYWVDATHAATESELRTEIVWPVRPSG